MCLTSMTNQHSSFPWAMQLYGDLPRTESVHSPTVLLNPDVISFKICSFCFVFSFTEQQNANEVGTGEGKRGITYEVRTPRVFNFFSSVFFFLFIHVLNFVECVSFVADIAEQGSYGQEEKRTSQSSCKTQKKVLQGSDKAKESGMMLKHVLGF